MARKEIRYLGRDFANLRDGLMNFTKVYFPNTYRNFNESSVGMLFIELASYVGDVLSYYTDSSLKESLLLYAEEEDNIYALANTLGYRPSLSVPAYCELDVFHIVPAVGYGTETTPDWRYALIIDSGMVVQSEADSNTYFRTLEDVNFSYSSSTNPTDVAVYEKDADGNVTFYVLKKTVKISAGNIKEMDFTFDDPQRFEKKIISDTNLIEILYATDSDGNRWYHVPYLAQDTMFTEVQNVAANDKDLYQYNQTAPYLLKLTKTARRFTSRVRSDKQTEIIFGSGVSDDPDELLIPNPTNVGSNVFGSVTFTDNPIDPANFLHTKTYGQAPQNTTITVTYVAGGGLSSNVNQGDLTKVTNVSFTIDTDGLDTGIVQQIEDSLAVSNPIAGRGGRDGESVEEIRQNALANFPTQLRAVTREDYITRVYSMPPRFGAVTKAYIVQDDQLSQQQGSQERILNPLGLNLYVLGYDGNKKLTTLNDAIKENLKVYLGEYRMLTDAINIKNGFIINIGIKFSIIAFKNYNKNEVLLKCVEKLKEYFNIDKWQFNQPITIGEVQKELFSVEGVQAVVDFTIENKWSSTDGYSGNRYDIKTATRDNIIYPALDPSIFEIKYPNQDIEGRCL